MKEADKVLAKLKCGYFCRKDLTITKAMGKSLQHLANALAIVMEAVNVDSRPRYE